MSDSPSKRRLIVCCDGTWNKPDQGGATNVIRLARAIKPCTADGIWTAPKDPRVKQTLKQVWFAGVHSNVGGGYPEHALSDAALFWMCANLEPLLDLDREQLCAQAERKRKYAKGRLVNSRTGTWRLFRPVVRQLCQTDPSERIHESVLRRLDKQAGPPQPDPYRDGVFLDFVEANKDRIEPLSSYETCLLHDLETIAAERTLARSHRKRSFCDRIVEWFGDS